jgi:hypothetical protein
MPSQGTTTQRGYGAAHEKQRRAWEPKVREGHVKCARCRQRIAPGTAWDLGHTDDRTAWTGPEHATCNRSAGGRGGTAAANGRHTALRHSRDW